MGNENGTVRLLTSSLPPLKKVNTRTEISDFCANVTAHIWIHTIGEVCKEYTEQRFIMRALKEKGWNLVGLSLLMLMCLGLLLLHLRRLQRLNQGVTQDHSPGRQNMTYSSTNDATPPASQAESIAASEVEAASLVHQSLPAHISFWIQMREGIRHPISTIRQSFHPNEPFPVLVRGIALYGMWDRMPPISEGPSQLPRGVWVRQRRIGLWHAIHLVWQPVVEGNNEPWITATQANDAATTLFNFLDKIAVSVSRGSQGREPARLVYRILHVEELKAQKPRLYRFRSRKKENLIKQSEIDVQETFVEKLQRQFDLAEVDPQSGIMPNRLSHYDRSTHRRGWIVISPIRALVAGVGIKQADILANLIQLHDIDISGKHKGILPERYEYVLMRIGMWNGTQDVYETVSQLEDLVESGKKSTDGQLWLNFVLATIGVLLAVFASPNLHYAQIWSLALLAVASVFYALYARSGRFIFQALGWILTALSIAVAIVALGVLPNVHP